MGQTESSNKVEVIGPNGPTAEDNEPSVSVKISSSLYETLTNDSSPAQPTSQEWESSKPAQSTDPQALQKAYQKGADDYKRFSEQTNQLENAKAKAQQLKELEKKQREEQQKLKALIEQLNSRGFRAPQGVVECSKEREAVLACYKDVSSKRGDSTSCKTAADAFVKCAQKHTEKFVKPKPE